MRRIPARLSRLSVRFAQFLRAFLATHFDGMSVDRYLDRVRIQFAIASRAGLRRRANISRMSTMGQRQKTRPQSAGLSKSLVVCRNSLNADGVHLPDKEPAGATSRTQVGVLFACARTPPAIFEFRCSQLELTWPFGTLRGRIDSFLIPPRARMGHVVQGASAAMKRSIEPFALDAIGPGRFER